MADVEEHAEIMKVLNAGIQGVLPLKLERPFAGALSGLGPISMIEKRPTDSIRTMWQVVDSELLSY